MHLALDHLTAVDATPFELASEAYRAGCGGICLFLHAMDVLPLMPGFDLVQDRRARSDFRKHMADLGLTLELAYPFTLSARNAPKDFLPALDCAADLSARRVNLLVYDREPARRADHFAAFAELALNLGLAVAVEFFPASQVRTLDAALDLVLPVAQPGRVGVNVDLLHLMRSGGSLADLAGAPEGTILFGQFADGPACLPEAEWAEEASSNRMRPGEGAFDLNGFARALPPGCAVSVEVPRDAEVRAGLARSQRVSLAIAGLRRALAEDLPG